MRRPPRPTDAELEVLRVLWKRGPCTVRQIHDVVDQQKRRGYTTILKTVQIMTDKGLVIRDTSNRSHVYRTRFTEGHTQRQLLRDLSDRAFGGSVEKLMRQVCEIKAATPRELAESRAPLIDRHRQREDR
jgi:BlaI family transcriptional regulator, penicillinase repressor